MSRWRQIDVPGMPELEDAFYPLLRCLVKEAAAEAKGFAKEPALKDFCLPRNAWGPKMVSYTTKIVPCPGSPTESLRRGKSLKDT